MVVDDPDRSRRLLRDRSVDFEEPVPTAKAAAERLGCEVGAIANSHELVRLTGGLPAEVGV